MVSLLLIVNFRQYNKTINDWVLDNILHVYAGPSDKMFPSKTSSGFGQHFVTNQIQYLKLSCSFIRVFHFML